MFLESVLIPVPSEITMPFSGFLVSQGKLALLPTIIAGILGNTIGASLAYYLGYKLGEKKVEQLVNNYGKFVLISQKQLANIIKFFQKYGFWVIIVSRFLPGIRVVISLPAGIVKINFAKFILTTVIGSIIWIFITTQLGIMLGKNWQYVTVYLRRFDLAIIITTIILLVAFIYHKIK